MLRRIRGTPFAIFASSILGMRVRLVVHLHQLLNTGVRVALRRGERNVAQQFLNRAQVRAVGQQMRRKGVAQRWGCRSQFTFARREYFFTIARTERVSAGRSDSEKRLPFVFGSARIFQNFVAHRPVSFQRLSASP